MKENDVLGQSDALKVEGMDKLVERQVEETTLMTRSAKVIISLLSHRVAYENDKK